MKKNRPIQIIFNKFLLSFVLFSFITISMFSEHTCHDACSGCVNLSKTAVVMNAASAHLDDCDHICIACLWVSVNISTGGFDKIIFNFENSAYHFVKTQESYQFHNLFFDFRMRAPPLV